MRLKHPDLRPAGPIAFRFDGRELSALPGETIAAALAAADIVAVRQARSGSPRGPFCGMGVCFDCLVTVDGRPNQRACLSTVEAGMDVRSSPAATAAAGGSAEAAAEIACDVLVVGAGPAGLAAARALALAGAEVVVLDERLHAGGQYFKPLAPSHQADASVLDRQFRDGAVLRQSAVLAGVTIVNEATVWAAFSPAEIAAVVAGQARLYRPKRLVLATGAYEQSWPVPGWTLPGVMTVGGLQTLARSYRVAPGERIVIAGNGPLCLQTAIELLEGGANVGSNFTLTRFDDAGATLGIVFEVTRSTGLITFNNSVRIAGGFGAFNVTPVATRPVVTGSRGGNAALASVLTALNSLGLISDTSTA